jgi:membrane-bound metal-dependent hydrolase YbcI (DUF457 family)
MMARGHMLSGVLGGLATMELVVPGGQLLERGAYVALCSVLVGVPDLDAPGAKLSRALGPITYGLSMAVEAMSSAVYVMTRSERDRDQDEAHRTFTHTLAFAVLAGLLVFGLASIWAPAPWPWLAGASMTVGCLSHLAGDCCTEMGCPLFWPAPIRGQRWRYVGIWKPLRFKTGKTVELMVITPLLAIAVGVVLVTSTVNVGPMMAGLGAWSGLW